MQNDIQLNRLYRKSGRHFEIQDGGRQVAFLAWHWPSKIFFIANLAMYQVSCFYHKMHVFSHIRPTMYTQRCYGRPFHYVTKIVSKYDKEIPQSRMTDQPTAL